MADFWKKILDKVGEYLYPDLTRCVCCGRELKEGYLCQDCEKGFFQNDGNRCAWCSRPTVSVDDVVCEQCKEHTNTFELCKSPLVYKDTVLELIHKFKYHERRDLGEFFLTFMLDEYEKLPKVDMIIPVPMWKEKYKERIYSTTEELGKLLSKKVDLPLRLDVVEKIRDTGSQVTLSREKRLENVKGCFKVKSGQEVKGKKILIVDDVYTTGATVCELARVLKGKKAEAVYVLTAAIGSMKR